MALDQQAPTHSKRGPSCTCWGPLMLRAPEALRREPSVPCSQAWMWTRGPLEDRDTGPVSVRPLRGGTGLCCVGLGGPRPQNPTEADGLAVGLGPPSCGRVQGGAWHLPLVVVVGSQALSPGLTPAPGPKAPGTLSCTSGYMCSSPAQLSTRSGREAACSARTPATSTTHTSVPGPQRRHTPDRA